jgi:hypothetical protein
MKRTTCLPVSQETQNFIHSKNILGIVTVFAVIMLAFPSIPGILPKRRKQIIVVDKLNIQSTEFKISGMTGCEEHVNHIK